MSKTIPATCLGGVVSVEGFPVPTAEILGEGVGESEGVLILDEERAAYIPKTSPDLETTLTQIISALGKTVDAIGQVSTVLTSIGASMLGPATAPPPTLAVDVAQISIMTAEITAAKTQLETLKGMLR